MKRYKHPAFKLCGEEIKISFQEDEEGEVILYADAIEEIQRLRFENTVLDSKLRQIEALASVLEPDPVWVGADVAWPKPDAAGLDGMVLAGPVMPGEIEIDADVLNERDRNR